MSDALSTLVERCRHQQEIRKSRFLAIAGPAIRGDHLFVLQSAMTARI